MQPTITAHIFMPTKAVRVPTVRLRGVDLTGLLATLKSGADGGWGMGGGAGQAKHLIS